MVICMSLLLVFNSVWTTLSAHSIKFGTNSYTSLWMSPTSNKIDKMISLTAWRALFDLLIDWAICALHWSLLSKNVDCFLWPYHLVVILTFRPPFVSSIYFIISFFPPNGVTQAADYVTGQAWGLLLNLWIKNTFFSHSETLPQDCPFSDWNWCYTWTLVPRPR